MRKTWKKVWCRLACLFNHSLKTLARLSGRDYHIHTFLFLHPVANMLLLLKWAGPAEKWNCGRCLSHTRGSLCYQLSQGVCSMSAVVGMAWHGMAWGWDGDDQPRGSCSLLQGSLSLPLPGPPFLEEEGLQGKNQSWSLAFHVLEGKV